MWPFDRDPKRRYTRFWKWFLKHEEGLYCCDDPHSPLMANFLSELRRVHPALKWQFGGQSADGRREFAVRADGIREAFDSVEGLVDASPPLHRFHVVRFRPPIPDGAKCQVAMNGIEIDGRDLIFSAEQDDSGLTDLLVLVPGCPAFDDQRYLHLVFLLLDSVLGEYDMECRIGEVHVVSPDDERVMEIEHHPLAELRDLVSSITS